MALCLFCCTCIGFKCCCPKTSMRDALTYCCCCLCRTLAPSRVVRRGFHAGSKRRRRHRDMPFPGSNSEHDDGTAAVDDGCTLSIKNLPMSCRRPGFASPHRRLPSRWLYAPFSKAASATTGGARQFAGNTSQAWVSFCAEQCILCTACRYFRKPHELPSSGRSVGGARR